jgi:hypothetical protein
MTTRQQLERLALASLTDEDCPDPETMAAHLLGLLAATHQLQVAAHLRTCPRCRTELLLAQPPTPRTRPLIARLMPGLLLGVRGPGPASSRRYQAANLSIELTIAPPEGDFWRLTGQLLRGDAPLAGQTVLLRAARRRALQQQSDELGFFSFEDLPTGRYTLTVNEETTAVQVRGILLAHEEA